MIARRVPGPGNINVPRTLEERGYSIRRCAKAKPLRGAAQPVTCWACIINTVEQSVQNDGGQIRSVTALHADTVAFLDGRRE